MSGVEGCHGQAGEHDDGQRVAWTVIRLMCGHTLKREHVDGDGPYELDDYLRLCPACHKVNAVMARTPFVLEPKA
ncbi:hypothetical protein Lesp02_03000 [Lentzea sp. NBRC 105346]|nr:hypothetical protein Lesp02_03000 [Lentzea sp. NBRC 105346]